MNETRDLNLLQVREYLQENSVQAVLNDLFHLALDIFNR